MSRILSYFSMVKFSHTVFALPFALVGFFYGVVSVGEMDWRLLVAVLLCMVFARNAAMGFNRYVDRRYDAANVRTAAREIPRGVISPTSALIFVIINALLFIATTWLINPLTLYLSPVALAVILGYSLTKRFTSLCHLILGLGLAIAPTGAYIAVTGQFAPVPILLSILVLTWVSGFDIIYALQDEEFDRGAGLYSIPTALGARGALMVSIGLHVVTTAAVIWIGLLLYSALYWVGAAAFVGLLVYQHTIVSASDLSRVGLAFGTTNGVASFVFALITIISLYV